MDRRDSQLRAHRLWAGAAALLALTGCGRVGYDPVVASEPAVDGGRDANATFDGPRLDPSDLRIGDEPVLPEAPPDAAQPLADGSAVIADVASPVDVTATPIDMAATPVDVMAAPADMASAPIDMTMDAPRVDPIVCVGSRSPLLFADFEDGTLNSNRVGARGGTPFHLIDATTGTISNVSTDALCGQRALRVDTTAIPKVPLVQAHFLASTSDTTNWYDARAYRGMRVALRASAKVALRIKIPNADTIMNGNDHFQTAVTIGPGPNSVAFDWSELKQTGSARAFPSFARDSLYGIEISATLPAGATLWIDEIAFVN